MPPSPASDNSSSLTKPQDATKKAPPHPPEPTTGPAQDSGVSKDSKIAAVNGNKGLPKAAEPPKDGKLSGKELKEKSKAEKAARRAQDKQKQQGQPIVNLQGGNVPAEKKAETGRSGSTISRAATTGPTGQHKRTGSVSHKSLPIRPTEGQVPPAPEEPKVEEKKVALFEHLYGHPRRTTLAGAGKDVHPVVLALGLQMSSYVICGSTARCVATLLAFKQVIESYSTPPHTSLTRHLTTHISSQIEYLVSCRPISVSMGNAIRWLKVEISEVDVNTPESVAKANLSSAIDLFIRERVTVADEVIAASAAEQIKDGDIIMTYAKSHVVESAFIEAVRKGKSFKVIVVDSRPLFEGKNLARTLAELGVEVQYGLTNGIDRVVKSATKVLLGAHAMMSNGRLYSRIGTALVAMSAKEAAVPVIVCCESIKFTDRVALDSFVHNELAPPDELLLQRSSSGLANWREVPNLHLLNLLFDVSPAEYITMVITEYGSLPPSSVPIVHRLSTNS